MGDRQSPRTGNSRGGNVARGAFDEEFGQFLAQIDSRVRLVVDRELKIFWQSDDAASLLREPLPLLIEGDALRAPGSTASLAKFVEAAGRDCERLFLRGDSGKHWAKIFACSAADNSDLVYLLVTLSVPHRGIFQSEFAASLRLTDTEGRVLDEFARLNTPREIAEILGVSLSTVRSHLKQIHSKAGVESSVQLTRLVRGLCNG